MYRFLLVFTLIFLVTFTSCIDEKQKGFFTDDEIAWLVYDLGDTIPFYSHQVGLMNFVVSQRTEMSKVSEHFPIEAEVLLESLTDDFKLKIYLLKDERSFKKYVRVNFIYRSIDIMKPLRKWEMDYETFTNVYEIVEDTTRNGHTITTAWFNKDFGFLKFTDAKGNIYLRSSLNTNELSSAITEKEMKYREVLKN